MSLNHYERNKRKQSIKTYNQKSLSTCNAGLALACNWHRNMLLLDFPEEIQISGGYKCTVYI